MTIQKLAAALIRSFEGLRLTAYADAGKGTVTIGFGHTKGVKLGDTITYEQAEAFLAEDCAPLLEMVKGESLISAAAYVSFGYNCGQGALQKVLEGRSKLSDYTHAGGKVLPGLVSRRSLEQALIDASSPV